MNRRKPFGAEVMGILNAIRASYGALHVLYRLSGVINLFCRRFDREKNRTARLAAEIPEGLLNGQNLPPLGGLPYGAWRMGCNGCEVIAAYNALQKLGCPAAFSDVADTLERKGLLFNGFGGTNLGALVRLFRSRDIPLHILRRRDRTCYDAALSGAECAVLSYWTGETLRRSDGSWNTLHTVFVHRCGSGIEVCNVSMNRVEPVRDDSLEAFLCRQNAVPVCLLALGKPVDKSTGAGYNFHVERKDGHQ